MRYAVIILSLFMLLGFNIETEAQQKKVVVKGTITDRLDKKPIPGVVISSGKPLVSLGQTDEKGMFTVSVDDGADLVFKYISYKTVIRKVNGASTINISMEEAVNTLKETTIMGYGKKTKEVSTGSSVVITRREIENVPVANVMELLQGKVAGMNVQNNNGTPGMRGSINIRGISNVNVSTGGGQAFLTPTSPLYVLDGVPMDDNSDYGFQSAAPGVSPISLIPVEDIQQIEVLKDAQATSLYGSRGAYGVILITTRRGNSKVPIISYIGNYTLDVPPALRSVIGGKGERLMRIDQILRNDTNYYHGLNMVNSTAFLADSLNAFYNNSTDWQDKYYRTTFNQTHNVDVSGGDNFFNYKVNTGYYGKKGIVENTDFTRYNLNLSAVYQPNTRFKLAATLNNVLSNSSSGGGNSLSQNGLATTGAASSLLPPPSLFTATSDLLNTLNVVDNSKVIDITSNIDVEYELLKDLRASTTFSYKYTTQAKDRFNPGALSDGFNSVYNYFDRKNTLYNRTRLSYTKQIAEKHTFNVAMFSELNVTDFRADAVLQNSTPNDQIKGPLGSDWYNSRGGTLRNLSQLRTASLAGSFSYNYEQKYVLDLSYRIDGSSTNGPDAGYSKSPSVAVRWNFHKEGFMKSTENWLDFSSIRLSYGKNIVPTGTVYDVYGRYNAAGNYNQKPTVNLDLGVVPNTTLTPTTTTQYNAAFEAGFLNGRFGIVFETYYKQVDNMLREKNISNINAFSKVQTNEMSLVDYGYELSLNTRVYSPKKAGDFSWTVGVNGALNKDVMVHLPDNVSQLLVTDPGTGQNILYRLGRNSLSNVLLNTKGIYSTNADVPVDPLTGLRYRTGGTAGSQTYFQAGDPRWTDLNGDYILDVNDYVAAGNSQPLITGGLSSYMQYKGFTFSVSGSFTLIRDILNNAMASRFQNFQNPLAMNALVPIEQYEYWKASGDQSTYPYPYDYTRYNRYSPFRYDQTLFQEDGSYFKINSATLRYNIDRKFTQRWGMDAVAIYATAYNVYTFSNYSGPNPENVSDLGRDNSGGYPNARTYTLGLNIKF